MVWIRPKAVVFDVVETLFTLEPLRDRLRLVGLPSEALEGWFAGLLRDGMALDATGDYQPFKAVATSALLEVMAKKGVRPDLEAAETVVSGFAQPPIHPDVRPAMHELHAAGVKVAALTNGGAQVTGAMLDRTGVGGLVERIVSVEEVRHWKPRGKVYLHAAESLGVTPSALALVAAHAWDIHGAGRAGLTTGFVARHGEPFPAMMEPPDITGADLVEVVRRLLALPQG